MIQASRRTFVSVAAGLATSLVLVSTPAIPQSTTKAKPEVKWSEAKPIIWQFVETLSTIAKESGKGEFSDEEKRQMVEVLRAQMEAQNIYAFVDP